MNRIHCCEDITFKYLMKKMPELLQIIIEACTGKNELELSIENNEVIPIKSDGRKGAMDILCMDANKNLYNIEMQRSPITEKQILRFEYYSNSLFVFQSQKGQPITNVKDIYTIVLAAYDTDFPGLIRYYVKSNNNRVLPGIKQHLYIVNMPYIEILTKQKEFII